MEITVTHEQGKVPVAVLQPHGALDASSYKDLIVKAQALYKDGARYILIDLSQTPFMSSAGIVAIHTVALMLRGATLPDPEEGWEALRSVHRDRESGGVQRNLKLLNPTEKVQNVLEMVGFEGYLDIFTERAAAIQAFEA